MKPIHDNKIIALLPAEEFVRVLQRVETVDLQAGDRLYEAHSAIGWIWFPHSGMVSLVESLGPKQAVGTAAIGPEGVVGFPLVLCDSSWPGAAVVQIPGQASRMPGHAFQEFLQECPQLSRLLHRFVLSLIYQIARTSACHRGHSVERRCALWLLMSHDRATAQTFRLTQDFLAQMMGVQRPSISVAASTLQRAGLIRYSRGTVTILDRAGLEAAACECHRLIDDECKRLTAG